jgi:hypothetical protein
MTTGGSQQANHVHALLECRGDPKAAPVSEDLRGRYDRQAEEVFS